MSTSFLRFVAAPIAALIVAAPCAAQQRAGLMGELLKDIVDVQGKFVGLAKAMPAEKSDWRPATGVRSVREVFLHVASDNYLLPSAVGVMPDPSTGIKPTDFATLTAFENQKLTRDETIASIERSFTHLKKAMSETPDAKLDEHIKLFGQDMTVRQMWVMTTTHLHEHLGQSIAYARMNGVVPPWSK